MAQEPATPASIAVPGVAEVLGRILEVALTTVPMLILFNSRSFLDRPKHREG